MASKLGRPLAQRDRTSGKALLARRPPRAARRSSGEPRPTRPHMPGYGLPRDARGLLPWRWAEQRLRKSHNYWLITTSPDGAPHAMPVWGIWSDSAFYFSTGRTSRKAKNLAKNPRCIVCNELADQAVILHGVAEEVTDPGEIRRLGVRYFAKYKPWKLDPAMGPVYGVRPVLAFGMPEAKFSTAATRWIFADARRVKK